MKRAKVDLAGLVVRVDRWRREREHARSRAPEALWAAAAEVARKDGIHATARAIRFDYYRLKAQVEMDPSQALCATSAGATPFVEIEIPSSEARGVKGETLVELVGRHGERMRIVAAAGAVDVVGLARAFWSRTP